MSLIITNPIENGVLRKSDKWGAGHFGASRGTRKHNGIDIVATLGQNVLSPIEGKIVRKSHPYATDLSYSGVLIEGINQYFGLTIKIFYISPTVSLVGKNVKAGDIIGKVQSLLTKFPGITNHIHLEIMKNGTKIDPKTLLSNIL